MRKKSKLHRDNTDRERQGFASLYVSGYDMRSKREMTLIELPCVLVITICIEICNNVNNI